MTSIPGWVWVFFGVAAVLEVYFFLMQRSALETCRASGLPDGSRMLMLPASYGLTWWAVASKWLGLALLAWYGSIFTAAVALGVSLAATTFVPVPHRVFLPAFERRLEAMNAADDSVLGPLLDAVRSARAQLNA